MNLSDSTTPHTPTVEVTRWTLPIVAHSEELNSECDMPALPTAEEIAVWEEEGRQKGYEEGYKSGLQAGRDAGEAEIRNIIEQISSLIDSLDQPFRQLDEQVENELMLIIVTLAQQLVRREIRHEPGEIIGVIRESMALLPANDRSVRVNLHPDDAALIREALASSDNDRNWTLVEDPLITRGGCRIGTEVSKIDVTLEARLASLAATMLGGEREGD